jgi:hypothetical protein
MIDRERFELIKRKHGSYASWAVWTAPAGTAKSNIGDLSLLDVGAHAATLNMLRNDVVMVGLSVSDRPLTRWFGNFHDPSPRAQDFKIRYAFTGTPYYGAYMTDIVKKLPALKATDLRRHLKADPALVDENVARFRDELRDLGVRRPLILAFGADAHALIAGHMAPDEWSALVRLTHYSHHIGKQQYREAVLAQISAVVPDGGESSALPVPTI